MARFSRALVVRPVQSLKHVVDTSGIITGSVESVTDIVTVVDNPVTTSPNNVHVGSTIKFIFLAVEILGRVPYAGAPRVYMYVLKNPSNEIPTSFIPPDAVGINRRRKWVIHQEMKMVQNLQVDGDGFPRTLFHGVILIPKKYQRFGVDDKLQFVIANATGESTGSANFCLQSIYKEFF